MRTFYDFQNLIMRRKLLLLTISLLLSSSCTQLKKDENPIPLQKEYLTYILAGQNSGNGIFYHLSNPAIELQLHPGASYHSDSCIIDINGDGIDDLYLKQRGFFSSGGTISQNTVCPLGNNEIAVKTETLFADTIVPNDTIDNKLFWQNSTCILYNYISGTNPEGYWFNAGIKYVGVRVHASDTLLFGWVRILIYNSHFQYIYEYAGTIGY